MDTQYQCRPDESNSSRYILENTELDNITDKEVISLLIEYKTLLSKYDQLDAELSNYNKILFYQPDFAKENKYPQKANAIVSKMDKLDAQILDLETRPQLLEIVEKHRAEKSKQRAIEEREQRLRRFRTDPSFDPNELTDSDVSWDADYKGIDEETVWKLLEFERKEMLKKVGVLPRSEPPKRMQENSCGTIDEHSVHRKSTAKAWAVVLSIYFILFIAVLWFSAPNGHKTVYLTKTGECYHRSSCTSLSHSKYKTTIEDAVAGGYRRCENCDPPKLITHEKKEVSLSFGTVLELLFISVPISFFTGCLSIFIFQFFDIDEDSFKLRWFYFLSVFCRMLYTFVL